MDIKTTEEVKGFSNFMLQYVLMCEKSRKSVRRWFGYGRYIFNAILDECACRLAALDIECSSKNAEIESLRERMEKLEERLKECTHKAIHELDDIE